MRRYSVLTVLGLLVSPTYASGPLVADLDRGAGVITAPSAYRTVETLSAPEMQGRLSGTEGYRRASEWVSAEVRRAGLSAFAELPGYCQSFTHGLAGVETTSLTILPAESDKDAKPVEGALFKDYAPMVNGGSGDVTAEVVFVGFGFKAPEQGRDDYAGVDVKGKIVMALRGEPEKGDWKEHRSAVARTQTAARMGAAAFLLIDSAVISARVGVSRDIPEGLISEAFADRLLATQKITVAELRKVMAKGGLASLATGCRVRFAVKGMPWREVTTQNVVAFLPGSDPSVQGEYVVLGAHLDHLGEWPRLNPGADDNASGSAVLLEIARGAASLPVRPRRSLVFVWFAAEELGLLGSEHFALHPLTGFTKCTAVLNMDMLGAGNGLYVAGGDDFPTIKSALEQARDRFAPGLVMKSGAIRGEGRADHAPFFERGIQAVSLFGNGGEHHGYHSPEDNLFWITPKIMEAAGRTILGAAWTLADQP